MVNMEDMERKAYGRAKELGAGHIVHGDIGKNRWINLERDRILFLLVQREELHSF